MSTVPVPEMLEVLKVQEEQSVMHLFGMLGERSSGTGLGHMGLGLGSQCSLQASCGPPGRSKTFWRHRRALQCTLAPLKASVDSPVLSTVSYSHPSVLHCEYSCEGVPQEELKVTVWPW